MGKADEWTIDSQVNQCATLDGVETLCLSFQASEIQTSKMMMPFVEEQFLIYLCEARRTVHTVVLLRTSCPHHPHFTIQKLGRLLSLGFLNPVPSSCRMSHPTTPPRKRARLARW
jgi:hypothetical protein